jgi:hypothetical protein
MNKIRVLRVIEYIGPREEVEKILSQSIQGDKYIPKTDVLIRTATVGNFPEVFAGNTVEIAGTKDPQLEVAHTINSELKALGWIITAYPHKFIWTLQEGVNNYSYTSYELNDIPMAVLHKYIRWLNDSEVRDIVKLNRAIDYLKFLESKELV